MNTQERWFAVAMVESKVASARSVAKLFGTSHTAVNKLVLKFRSFATVANLPRSGRPRLLSDRESRALKAEIRRNPKSTAAELLHFLQRQRSGDVSVDTVRRERLRLGFKPHLPSNRPSLSDADKLKRVAWAKEVKDQSWDNIVMEDEAVVYLRRDNRLVWVLQGEKPPRFEQKPKGKTTVAGAMSVHGLSPLVFIDGALNSSLFCEILDDDIRPWANTAHPSGFILQLDRSSIHTAGTTKSFMSDNNWSFRLQPPRSPDTNSMEPLWSCLKSIVQKAEASTLPQLEQALLTAWQNIPVSQCRKTVEHVQKRMHSIISSHGEYAV
jgi:transposase